MNWITYNWWPLFIAIFVLFLLTSRLLAGVAKHFRLASTDMPFSIFDLALPPSQKSFIQLLNLLDADARLYVKRHLLIDLLFMPAAYIGIAMLCFRTAMKMKTVGHWLFLALAAAQLVAWLFDVIENVYLRQKINNPPAEVSSNSAQTSGGYKNFQRMVKTKFVIAFLGFACSVFGLLYYWVIGEYQKESLPWIGGLALIMLLLVIISLLKKKQKKEPVVTKQNIYS